VALNSAKKIYFASDFHLGAPDYESSMIREKLIVKWLDEIKTDAAEIYLMGDMFDFWYEYRHTAPKGFVRFLGKLAELSDAGIPITFFTGNHDMWMFHYLEKEIGVTIYRKPIEKTFNGKKFYLGHGDGLGPGDHGYKFIKRMFSNKVCQWLFARIHPNFGMGMAHFWSHKSRASNGGENEEKFLGAEHEWLAIYAKEILQHQHFDYFVFGHRHLPLDIQLNAQSKYINLGEWVTYNSYAVFDGENLELKYYK